MPLCQLSRESISVSLRLAAQHRERQAQNRDGRGEEKDEEHSANRGTDEEQEEEEEERFGNVTHVAGCSAQSQVKSEVQVDKLRVTLQMKCNKRVYFSVSSFGDLTSMNICEVRPHAKSYNTIGTFPLSILTLN